MIRDVTALTARTHDLLVVGGGIYGLTIACDAAQRGLSVALVERADFGSGSTFNHLRTIHGGLRYLQALDIRRARESMRERRTLAHIAPHAVRPIAFGLPLYRSIARGRMAMRAAFAVDRAVTSDRNRGVDPALRLPPGRVVGRSEAIERFPGLLRRGLTGAAVWHDYLAVEADRLTFSWAQAAAGYGARLANYVEATGILVSGGRVAGVRGVDRQSGRDLEIGAQVTVAATGGRFDAAEANPSVPLLRAMNLVTRREAAEEAFGARTAGGRHLFLVPWKRRALFGTWEANLSGPHGGPLGADVERFIAALNTAFPALDLTMDDVTLVHRGAVPARPSGDGTATLETRERIIDHAGAGRPGLLSVAGPKYTTARATADRVVDRVLAALNRPHITGRTAETALPGGSLTDIGSALAEARRQYDAALPSDTIPHLVAAYGSHYRDIANLAAQRADWRAKIAAETPVIGAQLVWAARHEMAVTLEDAVVRRTPLGALGHPGQAAATRAADILAAELGWSAARTALEIRALADFYRF
jgi:glycerol-3-phosphate dehydrogenase